MIGITENTAKEAVVIDEAMAHTKGRAVAIDGGAHGGSQTVRLAAEFETVHAFEPCAESFANLTANCAAFPNVVLHQEALFDHDCEVEVFMPKDGKRKKLTSRQVLPQEGGGVRAVTIDSLSLSALDLLKLDLEGCEYHALLGARATVKRFHPFMMVEIGRYWKRFGPEYEDVDGLLKSWGYELVFKRHVDAGYIYRGRK